MASVIALRAASGMAADGEVAQAAAGFVGTFAINALRDFVTQNLSARPETESTQTSLVFEHFPGAGIPL